MEARLLRGALWRKRGTAGLAVLAVAIGASVASALLHVQGDVSRKLTRELRSLGPNLLLTAVNSGPASCRFSCSTSSSSEEVVEEVVTVDTGDG